MNDDLVLVQTGLVRNRLARIFWRSGQDQSLGLVEGGAGSHLALLVGMSLYSCLLEPIRNRRRDGSTEGGQYDLRLSKQP